MLVAKGFHKSPRIDYAETFGPVAKPATIRPLLSLSLLVLVGQSKATATTINNAVLRGSLK